MASNGFRVFALAALISGLGAVPVSAQQQTPSVISVPEAAKASPNFNVDAATDAYLALIPPDARARSDAYFEGGYWLQLWDFLMASGISLVLLQLEWSAKMRDLAERITRFKPLQPLCTGLDISCSRL